MISLLILFFSLLFISDGLNVTVSYVKPADLANETSITIPRFRCERPGYFCTDQCSRLTFCTGLGDSTFLQTTVLQCDTSARDFCNLTARDCSSWFCSDLGVDKQDVICRMEGTFPHPFDCSSYYQCSKADLEKSPKVTQCPTKYAFDASTMNCTSDQGKRQCLESPVPECLHAAQTGPVLENSTLFYICNVRSNHYIMPDLYTCASSSFSYNAETKICEPNSSHAVKSSLFIFLLGLVISLNKN